MGIGVQQDPAAKGALHVNPGVPAPFARDGDTGLSHRQCARGHVYQAQRGPPRGRGANSVLCQLMWKLAAMDTS